MWTLPFTFGTVRVKHGNQDTVIYQRMEIIKIIKRRGCKVPVQEEQENPLTFTSKVKIVHETLGSRRKSCNRVLRGCFGNVLTSSVSEDLGAFVNPERYLLTDGL